MENPKLSDRASQRLYVVDQKGEKTGKIVDRRTAHTAPGVKHLAVGVLVFSANNDIILHKRIKTKVGGDTIDYPVSHVLEGETVEEACWRCLEHEYGINGKIPLTPLCAFPYEHVYDDGTCENEYLIIFQVRYNGHIVSNPREMEELISIPFDELVRDIKAHPGRYAIWFQYTIPHVEAKRHLLHPSGS